ncbi:MAG TPA: primosomal protein N', partial [Saprospiraceae bacterium]|nr:primosomal protein N' [Saprospiraceae bacterium]
KARQGKFGFARLSSRYGNVELPSIQLINLKKARQQNEMKGHFSKAMIDAMKEVLAAGKQVLLFQNRRGHSPIYICPVCDWKAMCSNCDIALTYHKHFDKLICHLCNYSYPFVEECPACGSRKLEKIGLGTERIEEEVRELFPSVAVARLDFDTGSRKHAVEEILEDFQNNKTRILVGTQMIAKGVDFEHIGLVGILMADAMLYFPEYTAAERAFQLMLQVAGRAGRRKERGKVLIQTYNPTHPVFKDLAQHNYDSFVKKEWRERKKYLYPPFCRMVLIIMRHKDPKFVHQSATQFSKRLRARFGQFLIGPSEPSIARVRNYYIRQMMVKMPPDKEVIRESKEFLLKERELLLSEKGKSTLRLDMMVDP